MESPQKKSMNLLWSQVQALVKRTDGLRSDVEDLQSREVKLQTERADHLKLIQRQISAADSSRRGEMEGMQLEVREMRGVLAATREEAFRSEQAELARSGDMLRTIAEMAEASKRVALDTSNDVHHTAEILIKKVEGLVRDIDAIRRVQGVLSARFESEIKSGQLAVARANRASNHMDMVKPQEEILSQLRGEVNAMEKSAGQVAVMQSSLRQEVLRQEWLGRELESAYQRDMRAVEERVRSCEDQVVGLASVNRQRALEISLLKQGKDSLSKKRPDRSY
mmetsp:Transcript_14057/g.42268  ORF Transcript_14057/g.42268 Transcript_14057/m.42268 type:complete len:280 (+) Transcript_14057:138-977(+)